MDKMERQRQIESDPVRDGCVRWCQNTEYQAAADTKPYREVNVAKILLSRNRNRNAAKRAAELAALVDDEDDWTHNFRPHHLGEKLISLALQSAVFDGKPIFESKEDREGSGKGSKTMQRIGLTEAAETWMGEQTPEA